MPGLIFDVKPYSINDGPGIRITLFLKGCPLNCAWCHNPESISPQVQKMYTKKKCIGCGSCVEECPENALTLTGDGIVTDPDLCKLCGKCAEVCPTLAIEMSGYQATVDDMMKLIRKETRTLDESNGGVTISGGEPMMQSDFLIELLDALGEEGVHRVVDTTGMTSSEKLLEVAERTDLFLYDLKAMDSDIHKKYTGVGNEKILENLKLLAKSGAEIIVRIPLIKGVNIDRKNIKASAEYIADLPGNIAVNLLPYHDIARAKHEKLEQEYESDEFEEPKLEEINRVIGQFAEYGIVANIGG
ncbi:MAG: glycyl-radical enzyme activating protein [Bacteroidetes bacterium]|jgi:pyruvate formate lyase activating enzyme|nr:glycyl-radical enzyme activating protein [Bacteroidota bacterium]MBT3749375.1 glycyl-radical enzyme activating protein [Bacteroidota bacterium]MBT4399170.1 glycyl-radical enzyme activating protein [Bacteroidota bacterium]MBT4411627.1 glycyl-radical enzyme activating protein [Bacteroidota bacterium]MBT5427894.1 glycyl-radical enzyme activating protein [Bacteroidota bacterium]